MSKFIYPRIVKVHGGTFTMGDSLGDRDEVPHTVTLGSFFIGKYSITFEEYDLFCEATDREKPDDEGWGRGSQPVINVSWHDAMAYCKWLTAKIGRTCALPTEAQWEYAAREGGKDVRFGNGKNTLLAEQANFDGRERTKIPGLTKGEYYGKPLPVNSFAPNKLGLHNMSGNVFEWCNDWYDADYYKNSPANNPKGPDTGTKHVLRGGSWGSYAQHCRSAYRGINSPDDRSNSIGFRIVI